ncbi:MAG: DUF721 domain-containing protein [Flavobacteriales bacterium]|nr:DUF721 domain-containing protein [Flavobacteriales bacterium]MCC6939900.1 DUF721 domain-containing protein [Flavobacteriales bacterium]
MKRRNEQSLGEALAYLIDAGGMREKMDELDIASWWDEAVGGMIARHTIGITLKRGKLAVRVDSSPLRQELTYMRATIIELLNKRMGREVVKEIVLL